MSIKIYADPITVNCRKVIAGLSLGGYPPLLAAWAPFVLFALIGETVLIRTEE